MADFGNYRDDEKQRRGILLGAALGIGAAFAIPVVRREAAKFMLGGVAKLGRRYGAGLAPMSISSTASELAGLVERGIPRAAQASMAAERAALDLEVALSRSGAENAAIHARELATTTAFRRFLNTGVRKTLSRAMRNEEVGGIIGRHAAEVARLNPSEALDSIMAGRRRLIEETIMGVARPTLQEAASLPATRAAREAVSRLAGKHLEGMTQRSLLGKFAGLFGVENVTLGHDLAAKAVAPGGALNEAQQTLLKHATEATVNKLPLGGVFHVDGQEFDIRGALNIFNKGKTWLANNFQIPIAPGMGGIAPGQLFPWKKGANPRDFAIAQRFGRDPIGRAILGSKTDRLGAEVIKVGKKFVSADFNTGLIGDFDFEGNFYSGIYGAIKRRSMQVNAAQKARAAGINGIGDLLFNTGWQHTELGESMSMFTKFKDPRWAPNLFGRIVGGDAATLVEEDIERAGHFLTSQGLSKNVQTKLAGSASFGNTVLDTHAANLLRDEGVVGFFNVASQDPGEILSTFKSGKLRSMIREYQVSPGSVIGRARPSVDFASTAARVSGIKGDKTGIHLMREAIADELEERVRSGGVGNEFLDWVRAQGFGKEDLTNALGYGHGKQILTRLRGPEGVLESANYLRGDPGVRGEVSSYLRKNVSALDFFRNADPETLNTAELLVPNNRSIVRGLLQAVNEARKAGESPLNAIVNVVKGSQGQKWLGQYTSFFTGNQANVTATTIALEHIPRRTEALFQSIGLGLPERDLLSGGSIAANLMLKRVAPAVAAYELYRYSDYKLHEAGLSGPSDLYANLRTRAAYTRASLTGGNFLGLGRRELFPGLEKLVPNRTLDEEVEFQKSGYEPVRRGRFWLMGSRTPFLGDKINYFLPNASRMAASQWQGASNVDLNTKDYWSHSFIPLPENNFLGPLNWARDRYWWENKHSVGPNADRPYLVSGELADPQAIHGPLVNSTIGRILKPQRVLHPEYLPTSLGGSASREQLRAINEAQKQGLDIRGTGTLVGGIGGGGSSTTGVGSPGVLGGGGAGQQHGSLAQITAAGQLAPLTLPADMTQSDWQSLGNSSIRGQGGSARLSRREIERINRMTKAGVGGLTKLRPSAVNRMYDQKEPFSEEDLDLLNYRSGAVQGLQNFSEMAGIYGFGARLALETAGIPLKQRGKIIATPTSAYGFARRVHEIGGGSLGEGVGEIGRRFLTRPDSRDLFNPVPNTMPGWLPGPEYFTDFRHGDPYSKIARGEVRLPGEAYERIHHPKFLQTRASAIGKDVSDIMKGMLYIDEPMSDYGEEATEVGTTLHKVLQRKWKRMGVLVGAEERLYNEQLGISGHYDAILNMGQGNTLVDIKTVNDRRYQEAIKHPFSEHFSQVNYYLHETGVKRGGIVYVNRDKPWETTSHYFNFNPGRFSSDINKVQKARQQILGLVDKGVLSRGDLYDPISRFEILSDVAPFSDNYTQLRQYLVEKNKSGSLTPEENARFQAAKKRVAAQKRTVDVTPYRFKNVDLDYKTVTVDKIIDPNTVSIRGDDHPLRLAGARSSNDRIEEKYGLAPVGMTAAEWQFAQFGIRPGSRVRVALEADPERRIADDVLKTQHAVIFRNGQNVNKALIESGVATEKETDYSSTGVAARFTPGEIAKGARWEQFAHMDTPLHNKFLRVRSPLEELERGIVFGKNTGSWSHPFRDFVSPTVSSFVSKDNPLVAASAMGGFASLFMRTKQGKKMVFIGGAIAGAALSILRQGMEHTTGEVWKPTRTNRREQLEEYWDILKYIKYRGLAAKEEQLAKKVEHVDIEKMSRELFKEGQGRARKKHWLERRKRELILDDKKGNQEEISKLQVQIEKASQQQGMLKLGSHATQALQYRELYRSTLYGIDPGTTPFLNMFRAFPKYKRELIQGWIEKSSEKERERIYSLLPRQEQRVIGHYLGIEDKRIPERPRLNEFFRKHPLPGPSWGGWAADVDLEKMREIAIKGERLDPQESGINSQQIEESEREIGNVPVPTLRGTSPQIQARLNEVLSGRGLKNVSVSVDVSPHDGDRDQLNVRMKIKKHREQDIINALQLT